jgi:hypothetical protein
MLMRRKWARSKPLHNVVGLAIAGATQHTERRRVGEGRGDGQRDRRDAVNRTGQKSVLEGLYPAGAAGQIGTQIRHAGDPQTEEASFGIEGERCFGLVVPSLVVGKKNLAAAGNPFDRTADPLRRPRDQDVLGIDEIFGAETAADIGRDEPHLRRFDAEGAGGMVTGRVDALRGDMGRVAAARGIEEADHPTRLHRVGDDAVAGDVE